MHHCEYPLAGWSVLRRGTEQQIRIALPLVQASRDKASTRSQEMLAR